MRRYQADGFVIATGARPYHPPDVDFSHPRIVDSDSLLEFHEHPRTVTIYGAGIVGCEYASIFRGLQIKVNLINSLDRLLAFLDDEIVDALSYHLREQGVLIRHNEEYERVVADGHGVRLHLKSKKEILSDCLFWAQGRTGNSDGMGLEEIGIQRDHRGTVVVNGYYQTAQSHVYAVGDVVGYPTSPARHTTRGVSRPPIDLRRMRGSAVKDVPTGIYTLPEISSVGLTEQELTSKRIPYEVGHASFRHLARAQITGRTTGMLKILFHRETLEILGIHCFGSEASEIVHIGQAIMAQKGGGNTLMYFINTTFNYPTMAEAYRGCGA